MTDFYSIPDGGTQETLSVEDFVLTPASLSRVLTPRNFNLITETESTHRLVIDFVSDGFFTNAPGGDFGLMAHCDTYGLSFADLARGGGASFGNLSGRIGGNQNAPSAQAQLFYGDTSIITAYSIDGSLPGPEYRMLAGTEWGGQLQDNQKYRVVIDTRSQKHIVPMYGNASVRLFTRYELYSVATGGETSLLIATQFAGDPPRGFAGYLAPNMNGAGAVCVPGAGSSGAWSIKFSAGRHIIGNFIGYGDGGEGVPGGGGGTAPPPDNAAPITPTTPIISTLFGDLEPPDTPEATVEFAAQLAAQTTNAPVNSAMFAAITSSIAALGPTAFKASKFAILLNAGDVLAAADALADLQTYIDLKLDPDAEKALAEAEKMLAALAPLKDQFLAGGYLDEFGEFCHTPQSMDAEAAQPGYVAREQFLPNDPVGFTDPGKQFPKNNNKGEPDTSRLSRQERARASSLGTKENTRHTGVITANQTGTWDQPQSAYNSEYPYNHITQSESGHLFEMDDTPGSERVHLYHRSGTFLEIDNTGTRVRRTVGNDYTILERDGKVHIIGNADVTIGGAHRVRVENTYDLEVHGATTINIFNDAKVRIAGNADLKVTGNLTAGVIGDTSINTMGKMNLVSNGDMNIGTRGRLNIQAVKGVDISSGSTAKIKAAGEIHLGSKANICVDGKATYLQSGKASSGTASVGEVKMDKDLVFNPNQTVLPPLAPHNRAEASGAVFESPDEGDDNQVAAWKKQRTTEGTATTAQLEAKPEAKDSGAASSGPAPADVNVSVPSGREFRADDKISKYFTLGDVTHKYSRKLTDKFGNTAGAKFKALSYLATNALDKIKSAYPSMVINSGLRDFIPPGGAKKSQHLTGHAVDISFPGLDRKGHFERAKELSKLVPYDQMLLEYNTPGGNGWIHISLTPNPRGVAFTMNNHRKVSANGQFAYIAAK